MCSVITSFDSKVTYIKQGVKSFTQDVRYTIIEIRMEYFVLMEPEYTSLKID